MRRSKFTAGFKKSRFHWDHPSEITVWSDSFEIVIGKMHSTLYHCKIKSEKNMGSFFIIWTFDKLRSNKKEKFFNFQKLPQSHILNSLKRREMNRHDAIDDVKDEIRVYQDTGSNLSRLIVTRWPISSWLSDKSCWINQF